MPRFRKRPVEIEAWRFELGAPMPPWLIERIEEGVIEYVPTYGEDRPAHLLIRTLEGIMTASQRDWVIKGVAGEVYPCRTDIFLATYEPA